MLILIMDFDIETNMEINCTEQEDKILKLSFDIDFKKESIELKDIYFSSEM